MVLGTEPVRLVYALADDQRILELPWIEGESVGELLTRSQITKRFPELTEIPPSQLRLGIFGQLAQLDALLQAGDRLEIYRPLLADPKEARRQRAKKKRAEAR